MYKRLSVLLLFAVSLNPQDQYSFDRLEIDFDIHWSRYLLAKHGCPVPETLAAPITLKDCKLPPLILWKERSKARDLALKMFE